jgi:DNA-directed RNA polymerase subunit beta'
MNRNGEAIVLDESGRERERFKIVYGSVLNFKDGDRIAKGAALLSGIHIQIQSLQNFQLRLSSRYRGRRFTMTEQVDSVTGFATKVITETKSSELSQRYCLLIQMVNS